jgi:sialidase-1
MDTEPTAGGILKKRGEGGYGRFRIPGLICMDSGKLLVCYECRRDDGEAGLGSDWASSDIAMKTSSDGGRTWSKDEILALGHEKNVNNPVMFADGSKVLLLYHEAYRRAFCRRSGDGGRTWTAPEEITEALRTPDYDWTAAACGPGHGTVLSTGRYVVPVWMCANHIDPLAHHPSVLSTLYSDDRGVTWHLGEMIDKTYMKDPSETALVELADGTVMINIRHEAPRRRRMIAYSADGSKGWHGFHFEEMLPDPICMGGMAAKNGTAYFVNCCSETKRRHLTVYRTCDGAVWENLAMISEPAGYSDIAVSPDGTQLYVIYEESADPDFRLAFAAFDISKRRKAL